MRDEAGVRLCCADRALVDGRQLGDFLHLLSCHVSELLEVDAGALLADENDRLRASSASDENTHLLEMFALQHQEGVCLDAYRSGKSAQTFTAGNIDRWPNFSRLALAMGWVCGVFCDTARRSSAR